VGVNIGDPDIDHVAIAKGYGAGGERVVDVNMLAAAMRRAGTAAANGRSYVIDAIIAQRGPGAQAAGWRE
jgi:thiamine pyrophosphate-dependent acetolactate synthase large subunit-like protein